MTENIQHDSVETTFIIPLEDSEKQRDIITILVDNMCSTAPESIPKKLLKNLSSAIFQLTKRWQNSI